MRREAGEQCCQPVQRSDGHTRGQRRRNPGPTQATAPLVISPSATPASSAAATPGGIQNLVVTSDVRSQLISAYAFMKGGMSTGFVLRTTPGSVYYAYDPATRTY
jgi:hypothetical protein